jgi:hypothetical protein
MKDDEQRENTRLPQAGEPRSIAYTLMSPRSIATLTSWAVLPTRSFFIRLARCASMVREEMPSWSAISRLE